MTERRWVNLDWEWFIETIPLFLESYWKTLTNLLPYLIAGILISELLKFTSWTKIIYKWTTKSPFIAVLSAAVIGMVSPLCTYGTIPVVIELYKSGVRVAPLVTFLAASSLINPQLFIMTVGGIKDIGLEIAVTLAIAVFIFSLALGILTSFIPEKYIIKKNIKLYEDGGCNIIKRDKKIFMIKQYFINCFKNLKNVGFYLLIGIFLATILQFYIPSALVINAVGQRHRVRSILFSALLGVPLYACGWGAIATVNSMLHAKDGMGKGSALAFFIVGSATRPAPLSAMASLFTPLFLVGYCLFLIVSSVLMGLAYV